LLVVSDGDDSAKGWKSLFENVGVFEVHELHDFFVHSEHETEESVKTEGSLGEKCFFGGKKIGTSNPRELTHTPPGGSLWEGSSVRSLKDLWEGNRNSHSNNSDTVVKKPRQNGRKMTSFRGATAAQQSWELA
jgi:hypothetical protein